MPKMLVSQALMDWFVTHKPEGKSQEFWDKFIAENLELLLPYDPNYMEEDCIDYMKEV